jgi:coatomer protein complex subunit epsilon
MDPLFGVANSFHVGAYQLAINAGADLTHLSDNLSTERDALVYRAYIALGSHQARRTARGQCRPHAALGLP